MYTSDSPINDKANYPRSLIAILISVMVVGTTISMSLQLLSLIMDARGYGTDIIGMHSAMTAVAILTVGPFVPKLMSRINSVILMYIGIAIIAVSLFSLAHSQDMFSWFFYRYFLGLGICLVWVISETCINALAEEHNRGRIMGLYGCFFAVGFALGPIILMLVGSEGLLPFYIGIAIVLVSAIPLYYLGQIEIDFAGHDNYGFWHIGRQSPVLYIIGFTAGFVEVSVYALLHIYGIHINLPVQDAMVMLSVFVIGSVVLQPVIGRCADKFSLRNVFLMVTLLCAAAALLLPFTIHNPWLLWPMVFVWGGVAIGIYTAGIIGIGHRFNGDELAAANSGFIMMYAGGTLLGPSISGYAMKWSDPQGFVWALALSSILCFCLVWWFRGGLGKKV
ncbi:MFS transporter [Dasania sp. GY-MA-18]|uniref:MFS transporter n=1 Tax=Dasania phycosphaerae TaxID=2950436 RepID=A0A9J6RKW4_9GAMM|nr:MULTISPECIES: MFS transporter [Dasania]MCR8922919.1 MFS transporter [Dasania sp. GY-MA-18]MCZ0865350.1 MFS transporter [Dasania phycosphaerae]MCZ0869075.1 MFS transporter [Dasania phycosphaerae]